MSTAKSIPEDLRGKNTAVISGTAYAEYLDDKNVKLTEYEDPKKALTALNEASENTFFIHDIAEMRYYISRMDNINVITSATELLPQHYAFALHSTHAAYLPHHNKALVRVISEPEWLKEANSFAPNIKQ